MNKYRVNYVNGQGQPAHMNLFAEHAEDAQEVFERAMATKATSVELIREAKDWEVDKINEYKAQRDGNV